MTIHAHPFEIAPAALNLSKVAVGCRSFEALRKRQDLRACSGEVALVTRFMPKRAAELIGGSLYWIVKHQLVGRQRILGFTEREGDGRTIIRLDASLVPVRVYPKRAHQGWRYLAADDAPGDLLNGEAAADSLPADLAARLMALALI